MLRGEDPYQSAIVETIRGNEVVLQLEDRLGLEGTMVGLRPEMRTGLRIGELHHDTELCAGCRRLPSST